MATSTASGGGNVLVGVTSTGQATITVTYTYILNNALKPGNYTIVKTADPPGYTAGKDSSNGTVLNNPPYNTIPLTLGTGNMPNNDFGELQPASLSGYVYADIVGFNDGIKESTEPGISGVTVTLTGTNNSGSVNVVTTTNSNGLYQFTNLQPGNYTITETHPTGWIDGKETIGTPGGTTNPDQFTNINLEGGVNGINNNFGEIVYGQLSGTVFYDGSATGYDNGVQDTGEPGISGVALQLTGTDIDGNAVSLTTTTNANGNYSFGNLVPGTYTINETQPANYIPGKQTVGSLGGQQSSNEFSAITLAAGASGINYNFAELLPSTISGYVYLDTSATGYDDGIMESSEQGLPSVTVTLTGTSDQGAVSTQTTTNASGFYSFTGLRPGSYTITKTHPNGYVDGKTTVGTLAGQSATNVISGVTMPPDVNDINNNFGELLPLSSLSGYVYADTVGFNDGIKEPTEAGISGVTVTLTGNSAVGSVDVATTTDSNGFYQFTNLQPGNYTITETHPTGWIDGKDTIGTPGGTTNPDQFTNINLAGGVNGTNNNFGEIVYAQLSGTVFYDGSATGYDNGVQDPGEPGIAGVALQLTGTDIDSNAVSLTTTTNANGNYSFGNLAPGTYTINETQPANYLPGKLTVGSLGGQQSSNEFSAITLAAGARASTTTSLSCCRPRFPAMSISTPAPPATMTASRKPTSKVWPA